MSVLSTVTSSLPNVLNLLQGKWDVQYKVGEKSQATSGFGKLAQDFQNGISNAIDFLNGQEYQEDGFEWKSLDFDTFFDMQEVAETTITQNPVEGGSFRSTNKIIKPKQIKVTLIKAGIGYGIEDSLAEVKMLLPLARYKDEKVKRNGLNEVVQNAIESIIKFGKGVLGIEEEVPKKKSPLVMEFRILTPFDMIKNLNLIKLDYTFKKESGRNMLIMYLTFQEILDINTRSSAAKNIKNPTNSDPQNVGLLSATKGG